MVQIFPPDFRTGMTMAVMLLVITFGLVLVNWRFLGKRDYTTVTGRGAGPKSGDVAIRDPRRVFHIVREAAESASEDHSDLWAALCLRGDRGHGGRCV